MFRQSGAHSPEVDDRPRAKAGDSDCPGIFVIARMHDEALLEAEPSACDGEEELSRDAEEIERIFGRRG